MMELLNESINLSVGAFNAETYEKLQKTIKLKRTMRFVNQQNYDFLFWASIWYPYITRSVEDVLAIDVDRAFGVLDKRHCTYDQLNDYLLTIQKTVNTQQWSIVTNYFDQGSYS